MIPTRLWKTLRIRAKCLALIVALLPATGGAHTHLAPAIDRVDEIRARLLAHAPEPVIDRDESCQPLAQWFNFPNWPNWGNWNNWNNWANWGNWLNR